VGGESLFAESKEAWLVLSLVLMSSLRVEIASLMSVSWLVASEVRAGVGLGVRGLGGGLGDGTGTGAAELLMWTFTFVVVVGDCSCIPSLANYVMAWWIYPRLKYVPCELAMTQFRANRNDLSSSL
jgi:hypothetical protein